uniref:Uncharacterized protein n=1 Tax=Oryza rufipogon TaxID=4529 RepID=A0A0E0Q124_ORYRU
MLRDNRYNLQLKHMIIKYMEANIIFSGFRPDTLQCPRYLMKLCPCVALSIVSVSLLAVENLSDVSPLFLTGLLEAVVAALFMNIYIVGLYQLFDIEIDKPTLPLASVEYSPATGVALVSAFAAML